jgi:hypothetical protein
MEKVLRLLGRPIATGAEGCRFTYADTGEPVPVHTYASLARSAVARWMASPGHLASLLSPGFRRIGSAVAPRPEGTAAAATSIWCRTSPTETEGSARGDNRGLAEEDVASDRRRAGRTCAPKTGARRSRGNGWRRR